MADIPDHRARAVKRLATQYRESSRLIDFLKITLRESNTLAEVLRSLYEDRTIEKSSGFVLDVIGIIVGQPRIVKVTTFELAFAYRDIAGRFPLNTDGFGTLDDPALGAPYISLSDTDESSVELDDEQYKAVLKARIVRNYTTATPEDVIFFTKFITGEAIVAVEELGNASAGLLQIGLSSTTSSEDLALATQFLPKPIGVKLDIAEFIHEGGSFAFAGYPEAGTFGDATDPSIGGSFVQQF